VPLDGGPAQSDEFDNCNDRSSPTAQFSAYGARRNLQRRVHKTQVKHRARAPDVVHRVTYAKWVGD
jgi:hypothetical protein